MKFERSYRPWKQVISRYQERPHMEHVYLDVERKCLMATDGHGAIIAPCVPEEGDLSGFIPREAFTYARRRNDDDAIVIDCSSEEVVRIGKTCFERPKTDRPFPPVLSDIPEFKTPIRINVDVIKLVTAAKSIGAERSIMNITLTVEAEDNAANAMLVEAYDGLDGAKVVVMPLRPLAASLKSVPPAEDAKEPA